MGDTRAVNRLRIAIRKFPLFGFHIENRTFWIKSIKFKRIRFANGIIVDSAGHSGGLVFFWNDVWTVDIQSFSRDHIDDVIVS